MNRRKFLQSGASLAAMAAMPPLLAKAAATEKMIGIQIGAISFVDEGVNQVLDILQERGSVNTLFLSAFTYDLGTGGRQVPSRPLPDHGKQEYDKFHGGNYATPHAAFYTATAIKGEKLKAPDFGDHDILKELLPNAKRRGLKTICSIQDGFSYPGDANFQPSSSTSSSWSTPT